MEVHCPVVEGKEIWNVIGKPFFFSKEFKGTPHEFDTIKMAFTSARYVFGKDLRKMGVTETDVVIIKEIIAIQPYMGNEFGEGYTAHAHIYYKAAN